MGGVGVPYKAPRATGAQREGGSSSWIPGDQRLEEWAASHACPGSSDYTHGLTCRTLNDMNGVAARRNRREPMRSSRSVAEFLPPLRSVAQFHNRAPARCDLKCNNVCFRRCRSQAQRNRRGGFVDCMQSSDILARRQLRKSPSSAAPFCRRLRQKRGRHQRRRRRGQAARGGFQRPTLPTL